MSVGVLGPFTQCPRPQHAPLRAAFQSCPVRPSAASRGGASPLPPRRRLIIFQGRGSSYRTPRARPCCSPALDPRSVNNVMRRGRRGPSIASSGSRSSGSATRDSINETRRRKPLPVPPEGRDDRLRLASIDPVVVAALPWQGPGSRRPGSARYMAGPRTGARRVSERTRYSKFAAFTRAPTLYCIHSTKSDAKWVRHPAVALLRDRRVVEVYDRRQLAGLHGCGSSQKAAFEVKKRRSATVPASARDAGSIAASHAFQRPRLRRHATATKRLPFSGEAGSSFTNMSPSVFGPRRRPRVVQPVHGPRLLAVVTHGKPRLEARRGHSCSTCS